MIDKQSNSLVFRLPTSAQTKYLLRTAHSQDLKLWTLLCFLTLCTDILANTNNVTWQRKKTLFNPKENVLFFWSLSRGHLLILLVNIFSCKFTVSRKNTKSWNVYILVEPTVHSVSISRYLVTLLASVLRLRWLWGSLFPCLGSFF